MYAGKCPSCEQSVSLKHHAAEARGQGRSPKLRCVSYCCSMCDAILGVQADPLALNADLTDQLAKRLGAR